MLCHRHHLARLLLPRRRPLHLRAIISLLLPNLTLVAPWPVAVIPLHHSCLLRSRCQAVGRGDGISVLQLIPSCCCRVVILPLLHCEFCFCSVRSPLSGKRE